MKLSNSGAETTTAHARARGFAGRARAARALRTVTTRPGASRPAAPSTSYSTSPSGVSRGGPSSSAAEQQPRDAVLRRGRDLLDRLLERADRVRELARDADRALGAVVCAASSAAAASPARRVASAAPSSRRRRARRRALGRALPLGLQLLFLVHLVEDVEQRLAERSPSPSLPSSMLPKLLSRIARKRFISRKMPSMMSSMK